MRGTGAEVEGRIEIEAEAVIANEEAGTRVLASPILIILHGRHLRALPASALIYLMLLVILLWIDPLRAALLFLRLDFITIDDRIIPGHHFRLTGTLIHRDRWTGTVRFLGETSRPSLLHQREREPAVHHLTVHMALFLPSAHHLANQVRDAIEVPPSRTEDGFRGVVVLGGDLPVDGDGIVVGTTATALLIDDLADPDRLGEIEKSVHHPIGALAR